MVFKVLPSRQEAFLWTVTFEDIKLAISLHVDAKQAEITHFSDILVTLVNNIFSGGESKPTNSAKINHNYPVYDSVEQIKAFQLRNRK